VSRNGSNDEQKSTFNNKIFLHFILVFLVMIGIIQNIGGKIGTPDKYT
jgi:hypothetical protein